MQLTKEEFNYLIKEATSRSVYRLIKEYQEERQASKNDMFFEGEKMEQVKAWLARGGWELVGDLFKKNEETKRVKYFVVPSNGERAKGEWAIMAGRIGEIFGQQIKQGAVKKEVIDPKAKKRKSYDPSADENSEKTGTHWFILTRDDLDWDSLKPDYLK